MDFPLSPGGLLDPKVAALVAMALTQWAKKYLPDGRYAQLLVLGCTLALEMGAALFTGGDLFSALMAGFWGASLATFGYEALANSFGLLGIGGRADQ